MPRRVGPSITMAGAAAGTALALGLTGMLSPARAPGTIRTAAFTLVSNANGTATLTLESGELLDPAALQSDLTHHGIPAKVTAGSLCSSDPAPAGFSQVVSSSPAGPDTWTPQSGVQPTITIDPSAMPAGTELSVGERSSSYGDLVDRPAPMRLALPEGRMGETSHDTRGRHAMPKIIPCLWFDDQGEDAAKLYTSVFPNSRILSISHYGDAGPRPAGDVMTVSFELDGKEFLALNGGPEFTFDEAISFQIFCETQDEIDHYWNALSKGGEEGPCGWLKDPFRLSWQVVPTVLNDLLADPDPGRAQRAMHAMLGMKKLDIAELERAAAGG